MCFAHKFQLYGMSRFGTADIQEKMLSSILFCFIFDPKMLNKIKSVNLSKIMRGTFKVTGGKWVEQH